ncbi:YhcB family protein [Oceanicoccus sp. KOV_DT_Chl]|uniref:YhcB family protein n=1 Tax=Oceanicoccus sp. KOV_DT_Chl TaxID=1904639 RepID=UPI0013594424|nr:DUF1043 family protein [Oceanicoccus sp. KOV_DT_Chl]
MELVITVGLAATIIGALIGFFIAQKTAPSQQSQKLMETQLKEMQLQQENYQHEVAEHFVETADLLNHLTNSYRDVHNHLAKGAQSLAGEHASENLKAIPVTTSTAKKKPDTVEEHTMPPLDYAPKTPNQPGMLNEEFGLEKTKRQEELEVILSSEDRM